jgi:hypothetical protein
MQINEDKVTESTHIAEFTVGETSGFRNTSSSAGLSEFMDY